MSTRRKKRSSSRGASGSTKPAAGSPAAHLAAGRVAPLKGQPPTRPDVAGEPRQHGANVFVRTSPPPADGRPSGAPPVLPTPDLGRSLVAREDLRSAVVRATSSAESARRPTVAPTTTLPPMSPPRLALRSGITPVEVSSFTCQGLEDREPQALGVTYWFDAAPDGDPYTVTVHLNGHLRGHPPPGHRGTFSVIDTLHNVVPGSGRVAVTTRVFELAHGTWDVTATPVQPAPEGARPTWVPVIDPRLPSGTASGTTAFQPVVRSRAPGVRLGAWPALVGTGTLLALVVQSLFAQRMELPLQRLLPLSLLACVLGLLGAKAYYLATHPRANRGLIGPGMSVQGFVLVAVATILGGSVLLGLPPGPVLDATAPGLLLGMSVGRLGCLLGGCCAGRPTSSRWAVWSSDRRVGVRRIPVQLLESSLAGIAGAMAVLAVLGLGTSAGGLIFIAAVASYIAGRQLLFPLRGIPRATHHGRVIMLVSAALVAVTATVALLLR